MAAAASAFPNTAMPPASPAITAQQVPQGSPMAAFAQNMAGQPDQAALQNFSSSEFLNATLNKIATDLAQVANVLTSSRPDLMPLVQKMAQIGSALTTAVRDQGQSSSPVNPELGDGSGMESSQEGSQAMTLGG